MVFGIRVRSARTIVYLVVAALLLAGCAPDRPAGSNPAVSGSAAPSSEQPGPGAHRLRLSWAGTERSYLLYAPPGYRLDKSAPLVIALHFYPGNGDGMRQLAGLDAKADTEGFLVAYPDGVASGFNALVCCGSQDDVGFLRALAAHLVSVWHADPDRVYLTGISNGGDMSFRAAVEASETFAAIGVVSGGFIGTPAADPQYAPKRPVSVVTIIGAADRYSTDFQNGIATWRARLGCQIARSGSHRNTPITETVSRCADGSEVTSYLVPDMGHLWPGATHGEFAAPDVGINATDIIWQFFATHRERRGP